MKVLLVVLFITAGAFSRSAIQQSINEEGPACPFPDPLSDEGPLPINVTFGPFFTLDRGSEVGNLIVEGLSNLHYEININAIYLNGSFELTLERVEGNAIYNASGYIDASPISEETIPLGDIQGSGLGKFTATGVHMKGRAAFMILTIAHGFRFRTLNLETVSFDSLAIDLGNNITIGGNPVDWADFSANIKENFDREFAQHNAELTYKVLVMANQFFSNYTVHELIKMVEDFIEAGAGTC